MTVLSVIATVFGVVSALAILPQVLKIYMRRKAADVSILTYIFFFIGTIIWFLYGLELNNTAILVGNSLGGVLNCAVIVGCLLYGKS